ncbi:hypothetical protein T492DRAFT_911127 [Pavlovales sp. CCMP2436]|nr:hypothetical protein T492DRAFT_911127 [Pavlovales sp. CCMP2436]
MEPTSEQAGFQPFDLLDDGLVLAILRCLAEPESLCCAAQVSKRIAELCNESYAWKLLLDLALSATSGDYLALPSEGMGWRERYKQWHTLGSLAWSHCPPAAGSAQPSARSLHGAAAVSTDCAYVFGGYGGQGMLGDMWMLRCDSAATGTASWELVAPTSEHTPNARFSATLSPVSLSDSVHPVGLLLFGGCNGKSYFNDEWLFDTRTAANTSVRPDGRFGHSAITHNSSSEVVIFGGLAVDNFLNDVHSLSVRTRQWTRHECAGASPSPRYYHAACREYALGTRVWTQGHSLVPLGNWLVVFGGTNPVANSLDSALHCFDLQRRRWSDLALGGEHPRVRTGHAAIPCGGGVLIFGGRGSSNELFNDTFLLRSPLDEQASKLSLMPVGPSGSRSLPDQTGFQPFDLLDDGLVLAILRCLTEPESLCCAAQKPLLDLVLSSSGEGFLVLPSEGSDWRERYKQWHALSSLAWSHCPPAAGSAQPSARFHHRAAAMSADRAYVFGNRDKHYKVMGDLWMLRCDSAATGTAAWELVAPSSEHTPTARIAATLSLVSLSDSAHSMGLLLFGGYGGSSFRDDAWLFDTCTAARTMLLPHTAQAADASVRHDARDGHLAITHNNSSEVVIFGGMADEGYLNDVLSFRVRTCQWTRHECAGASPSLRRDHSACRVAESMYVFGGNTGGNLLNDLWEYALDARAWTQVVSAGGSAPSPRFGHLLVPLGNRLLVFGGMNTNSPFEANSLDSALHCFDLQRRWWSDVTVGGEHPRARSDHAAIPCGGGVLIFGGLGSGGEHFNDTLLLRVWP